MHFHFLIPVTSKTWQVTWQIYGHIASIPDNSSLPMIIYYYSY
jgi:hypothetical protein